MADSEGVTVGVGVSDQCPTPFPCPFLRSLFANLSEGIFDIPSGNADSGRVTRKEDGDFVALDSLEYRGDG